MERVGPNWEVLPMSGGGFLHVNPEHVAAYLDAYGPNGEQVLKVLLSDGREITWREMIVHAPDAVDGADPEEEPKS